MSAFMSKRSLRDTFNDPEVCSTDDGLRGARTVAAADFVFRRTVGQRTLRSCMGVYVRSRRKSLPTRGPVRDAQWGGRYEMTARNVIDTIAVCWLELLATAATPELWKTALELGKSVQRMLLTLKQHIAGCVNP